MSLRAKEEGCEQPDEESMWVEKLHDCVCVCVSVHVFCASSCHHDSRKFLSQSETVRQKEFQIFKHG